MSLEASIVLMDNSDYARNGDLFPNRWGAQMEAIQYIANAKLEANMESGVGLILSAGKQVQLLMTPTNDQNQLIATCENQQLRGQLKFSTALYISQLTLKHRINKKQAQRIIAFVASPVEEDEASLVSLAKKLKKNNIAVDVINFGEQNEEHLKKLELFVNTVKKGNNCVFSNIKPGSQGVFDQVVQVISNQVQGIYNLQYQQQLEFQAQDQVQQANQPSQPQGGLFAEYGGIDPNIDPELAMVMKMSIDEERAKANQVQQAEVQAPAQRQAMIEEPQIQTEQPLLGQDEEEEELWRRAQELSLEEEVKGALQQEKQHVIDQKQGEVEDMLGDEEFMRELLESANVDLENEDIQKLLKKKDDKSDDKKDDKKQ